MGKILPMFIGGTAMAERDLRAIIRTAPNRYKKYFIEKRNGGQRLISQPAKEVKLLQRILMKNLLSDLRVHDAAAAYRKNCSIADNAMAHATNGPILKYDFENFFPSITSSDWLTYCGQHALLEDEDDLYITTKVFFHMPHRGSVLRLAVGAPSSPMLSNILMHDFDERLTNLLVPQKVTYTRYADDMTFSAKRTGYLNSVDKTLRLVLREKRSPKLRLNHEKTILATKKYRRTVTGLVLTNDGKISLGHERKKRIRAAVHHYVQGTINSEELNYLRGMLAFALSVEPDFIERLKVKFTLKNINVLLGRSEAAPS